MTCSICGEEKVVNKLPPLYKKCYNNLYKRKAGVCKNCANIKKLHTKELCDFCYRKTYKPTKKICCICGEKKSVKKNTIMGPVCKKCYTNKDICYFCNKYKEVCVRNNGNVMCRNCYNKRKRKKDKQFNIKERLRQRLLCAFKNYSLGKKVRSADEYGINYQEIIEKLKPFPKNIESYNIDHIFPLKAFDFNNPLHIKIAFDPENHQWLKKGDNFRKSSKYDEKAFLEFLNKKMKEL